jgi:hypothetical protein
MGAGTSTKRRSYTGLTVDGGLDHPVRRRPGIRDRAHPAAGRADSCPSDDDRGWRVGPGGTLFGIADGERAGAVVSGIPLLLMPAKSVIALLEGAFERLRPDGAFYQFTYGRDAPIARPVLDRLGLKAMRIGGTLANFPPAAVYRILRRPAKTMPTRWTGNRAIPARANA